ncbi:MFS transporter [Raineyella sp. LH-20]|uniref:MFS transporter n=1 Tax=Raineyella sp. LH-20 TaxID=3081204 RepID=UPI0029557360|nr:MFS transporter [Raineyella sp. LH-20]WOP19057.1 MFS transporter [Raineyella sp. LH-20]
MSPTSRIHTLHPERYKWVALSNTTLGALMASINGSIVLIAMPAIFNGIHLNPLEAGNVSYLLWMLMGYMLVTAVLVTTFGRLGDLYGRVRIYNLGFLVFTVGAIALSVDPYDGGAGAIWLILWRLVQAVGGSMIFANSTAIITDAFPPGKRGTAMGINQVAAIAGTFVGLVLGGLMAALHWRWVFLVSVPVGIIGTVWAYVSLHETGQRAHLIEKSKERLDAIGNVLFAVGLTVLLIGITYGIQPYGDHPSGWTNPWVIAGIVGGLVILVAFVLYEQRIPNPMLDVDLFRIRVFAFGNLSAFLSAVARGGLQFMLIIWLQGIWLPLHGFAYEDTPLWAGIYMLPLTIGFVVSGPLSGMISDRLGSRLFAPLGLVLVGITFIGFLLIPVNFPYWLFAVVCFLNGVGSGMFAAPNRSTVMSSVRPADRGIASGMSSTFMNAGNSLSIGVFFSLMIVGLAGTLPQALFSGLTSHSVPAAIATPIANMPPTGSLFAAFLGYNPIQSMLEPTGILTQIPAADAATLTGQQFFPQLISAPFQSGLVVVFLAAAVMSFVGALASLARGKHVRVIGTTGHVEPVPVEVGSED